MAQEAIGPEGGAFAVAAGDGGHAREVVDVERGGVVAGGTALGEVEDLVAAKVHGVGLGEVGEEFVKQALREGDGLGVGGAKSGGDFLDAPPRRARPALRQLGEAAVGGVAEPPLEVAEGVLVGHEADAARRAVVPQGPQIPGRVRGDAAPDGLVATVGEDVLEVEFQAVHAQRGEDIRHAPQGVQGVDPVARDVEHQPAHGHGHRKAPGRRLAARGQGWLSGAAHSAGAQDSPSVRRR